MSEIKFYPGDKVKLRRIYDVSIREVTLNFHGIFFDKIYTVKEMNPTFSSDFFLEGYSISFYTWMFELVGKSNKVGFIIDL